MKFNSPLECLRSCSNKKRERNELKTCESGTGKNEGNSLLQFIATISGCLSVMGYGTMLGWSSPAIPFLMSEKSEFRISLEEKAWLTSLPGLTIIIGYLLVPLLLDRLGRKFVILLHAHMQSLAWIIIIFSKSFVSLLFGRMICGIGIGGCVSVVSIYIGEIAEKEIRGILSSCIVIFSDLGVFLSAATGAYFSYNTMNLILLVIPLLHTITFVFMPESPYYYLKQGRDNEALQTLTRLRGLKNTTVLQSEIEEIKLVIRETTNSERSSLKQLFFKGSNLKALAILNCAFFASISSGSIAIFAYAHDIFVYSGFSVTPEHSFMIIVAVKIISSVLVVQLVERIGRRILFLSSGISCAIFQIVIGIYFFCQYYLIFDVSFINWLPLVSLISFQIMSSLGIGPIPFILTAELFSIQVKQAAVPCAMVFLEILAFFTQFIFPFLNEYCGIYTSFWIFGTCCFLGSVTLFCILPESKGKSLEEIQLILSRKKK